MKLLYKGLLLGAIQLALVVSLGGKLLYDRATRPRVWVRTAPVDPNLPIRGRYVALRLEVPAPGLSSSINKQNLGLVGVHLQLEGRQLVAVPSDAGDALWTWLRREGDAVVATVGELGELAFFIPEHVPDPSRRLAGEELWVEVTLPKKGPPRPIRLGVKKGGEITPLALR